MKTFTIILLIYVLLDIIIDLMAINILRRNGYTLKDIALKIRNLMTMDIPLEVTDEDMREYDNELDSWDDYQWLESCDKEEETTDDFTDLKEESEEAMGMA